MCRRPGTVRRHSSRSIPRKPNNFGFRARTSGRNFENQVRSPPQFALDSPQTHCFRFPGANFRAEFLKNQVRSPPQFALDSPQTHCFRFPGANFRAGFLKNLVGSSQIFVKSPLFDEKMGTHRGRDMPRRVPIFSSGFIKKTIYRSFSLDLPGDREFPGFSTQSVQLHSEGCESPHDLRPPHIPRPTSSESPAQCPPRCLVH